MNTEELQAKFGMPPLDMEPQALFQLLSAFWHHFALHRRKCDKTGEHMISVFDENCPYPVWKREEWLQHAAPPGADYDASKPFFEQLWELWQQSPIPHNIGSGNQNCDYTDDWWYSKDCYLCHSGVECENCYYSYRVFQARDCQFIVFSWRSERCTDLVNCYDCYNTHFALNSRQCRDSAFLFDCRNCSDCLFSWNLRNKQYCIFNQQYTKEEYEKKKAEYDFSSRQQYDQAKQTFWDILRTKAWWKNVDVEKSENCEGDLMEGCKNCDNSYLLFESEDCTNVFRGGWVKDALNTVSPFKSELLYLSSMPQDGCYDIRCCYNVMQSKNLEYSAHCYNCQDCFGCCGLVNKQYHIFNKPYSKEEYEKKVGEIREQMKAEGVYGQFFPKHFAACSYDESLAGFYWPLSREDQAAQGFRVKVDTEIKKPEYADISEIPDRSVDADSSISQKVFWDEQAQRPFQITPFDLKFCQQNQVPLPNGYYINRMKENFRMIFFTGGLRETTCAKTGVKIQTALPEALDGRILSREAYLDTIDS